MPLSVNPQVALIPFFFALLVAIMILIITFVYYGYCIGSGNWYVIGFVPGFLATIAVTVGAMMLLS